MLALLALVGAVFAAVPVFAADTDPVKWSLVPADLEGPDGRSSISHELDPGETVEEYLALTNLSDQEVTFQLLSSDGFFNRRGRFDTLPLGEESTDAGTWVSIDESVVVPAGQTELIPFSLTVPFEAEPGDHAAGITASVLSIQTADDGTKMGVENRIGVRVTTRVSGELNPSLEISGVRGEYHQSWNPTKSGSVTVTFDVSNRGNVRLLAEGIVKVRGLEIAYPAPDEHIQELLPGDSRTISARVPGVWPLFVAATEVVTEPTMITMDGDSTKLAPVTANTRIITMPWPQIAVVSGVTLLVVALLWERLRSRRKLSALLSQAREEGRQEAANSQGIL